MALRTLYRSIVALLLCGLATGPVTQVEGKLPFFGKKRPEHMDILLQDEAASGIMDEAKAAQARGNLKTALRLYKEISEKYPGSFYAPEALFQTAQIRFKQRKWKKSYQAYTTVILRYPDYENYNGTLQEMYEIASALMERKTSRYFGVIPYHNYDNAVKYFEVIVRAAPYSNFAPLSLMNVGIIHAKRNNTIYAVDAFDRLINNYPDSMLTPEARILLAEVFASVVEGPEYDQGATEEAIRNLEDYLILHPDSLRVKSAEEQLSDMREIRAESELEIARFYDKKRDNYVAARIHYNNAITVAPSTVAAQKARDRLAELPEPVIDEETGQPVRVASDKSGKNRRILPRIPFIGRKKQSEEDETEAEKPAASMTIVQPEKEEKEPTEIARTESNQEEDTDKEREKKGLFQRMQFWKNDKKETDSVAQ